MKKLLFFFLILSFASCSKNDSEPEGPSGPLPVITWVMSSGRFTIQTGESIQLVPDIEYLDETSVYTWIIEGKTVGHENYYTFTSDEPGVYYVKLIINNRYGKVEDEVKITVVEAENVEMPEVPEHSDWKFPWTEINVAQGRTIKVKAYMIDNEVSEVFTANEQGRHVVSLNDNGRSRNLVINVCPAPGTYRRTSRGKAMVNRVYEYMPAPGHQVNGYIITGEAYPKDCTHEQACDSVLAHFSRKWSVSLGGQGGYLIAGFDHSVPSGGAAYDLCIKGNAACSGHTECDSIIMDHGTILAVPALEANSVDASLVHEAAIGKIAGDQLNKLMTLGLTPEEAEEQIINGFLK